FRFPLDVQETEGLLSGLESKDVHVILVVGGQTVPSNSAFDPPIPTGLRALVEQGQLGYQRVLHAGRHFLLIGGRTPGSADDLYFVFSEDRIDRMPEEARRLAELMVQDVDRLRRLVEELMEVSRFDAGREVVRPEQVDVKAVAAAAVRSRGWGDRVALGGEPVLVITDRGRL